MQLAPVRPNDIVKIDKKGRQFLATVKEKERGLLHITPFAHEKVTYHTATAHEVIGHWRKMHPRS